MGFWKKLFKVIGFLILFVIIVAVLAFFLLPIKLSNNGIEIGKSNIICYSNSNVSESNITCTSDAQCKDEFTKVFNEAKSSGNTSEQPPEFFIEYLMKGIYCDKVCKVKQIKGFGGENVESCSSDETKEEIKITPYKLLKILQQTKQG